MNPNFITINYAKGSAGKFLISLLMSSDSAAHYDPNVKTKDDKIEYIKRSFVSDVSNWLLNEPSDKLAWNINFVSNSYPRGNDLTLDNFLQLCKVHCTEWFHKSVKDNKKIIIPWHKDYFPIYLGKDTISIYLDQESIKWFARAVWSKHYAISNNKIHIKENDPSYYRSIGSKIHYCFDNPIFVDQSFYSFVKHNIYLSQETKLFSDKKKLKNIGSKYVVALSDILILSNLEKKLDEIYNELKIIPVDKDIVKVAFNHWRSLHDF